MKQVDLALEPAFALGPLGVRPSLLMVTFGKAREATEPRVMQVLVTLARRCGDVVSRGDFADACWNGRHVGEDALQRTIAKVRRLGEWSGAFTIETIPRVGYRMKIASESGDAIPQMAPMPPLLAVLPFDALSSDPELAFFADGLADEILHTLAETTPIRLIGRASSFQLRGAAKAASQVGATLGATHLLDGSVRQSASAIRISVQLIEIKSGITLWSQGFDRAPGDALTLQSEIAGEVATTLYHKLELKPEGAVDPGLHEKIRRAFYAALDGPNSMAHIATLDDLARQAPNYALAWALAAEAKNYLRQRPEIGDKLAVRLYDEQRANAERALALDPSCPPALIAYGGLQPPCGAFTERETAFRQADGYGWLLPPYSFLLLHVGRSSEALVHARVGREREPLVGPVRGAHQLALAQLGRIDEWAALVENDMRRHPPNLEGWAAVVQQAALYGCNDMVTRWTAPERLASFPTQAPALRNVFSLIEACRRPTTIQYDAALQNLEESLRSRGHPPFFALTAACVFGDLEPLWDIADRACFDTLLQPGGRVGLAPYNTLALFLPHAASLRADPRFVRLCARLGLVKHWMETDRWPDCAEETSYDFRAEAHLCFNF